MGLFGLYFDFLLFFLHRVLPSLGLMYPLCNVCLILHFQGWSDLQKSDFVGVLANKMSDGGDIVDSVEALKINGDIINGDTKKPPSLYECQIKLFKVSRKNCELTNPFRFTYYYQPQGWSTCTTNYSLFFLFFDFSQLVISCYFLDINKSMFTHQALTCL